MGNKKQIEESLKSLILNDNRPFVAMLSGEWGVGKTYFWKEFTTNHLRGKDVVYISLFGQNSLADIETTIVTKLYKYNKTLKKYSKHLDTVSSMASKALHLPINVSAGSILSLFSPGDFKNIVICFDDFERLSDKVPLKDVMGLISQFKEQKECKVVMILNEGELNKLSDIDGKKHDEVFALYKEKVVDYGFYYVPNHEEVFEAIKEDVEKITFADHETIYQFFRETGLFNIRIMKQALYLLEHFNFIKDKEYDKKVVDEFVKIALNLFVFKLKSNYSYGEFLAHIKNSLYVPSKLAPGCIIEYGRNSETEKSNSEDKKEIKKHSENAKSYHALHYIGVMSPNQDKIEHTLYGFLERNIINKSLLLKQLSSNNNFLKGYDIRDNMFGLYNRILEDYSSKINDIIRKMVELLENDAMLIPRAVGYENFRSHINVIKEFSFDGKTGIEEKIVKGYIEYYQYRSPGFENPIDMIKEEYGWAEEYMKKLAESNSSTSLDETIKALDYACVSKSFVTKSLLLLENLSRDSYISGIRSSQEFAKKVENFIVHFRHYIGHGHNKGVAKILMLIFTALEDLRKCGGDEEWRIEKLEKRLGIDTKKELKKLKIESRKDVDET